MYLCLIMCIICCKIYVICTNVHVLPLTFIYYKIFIQNHHFVTSTWCCLLLLRWWWCVRWWWLSDALILFALSFLSNLNTKTIILMFIYNHIYSLHLPIYTVSFFVSKFDWIYYVLDWFFLTCQLYVTDTSRLISAFPYKSSSFHFTKYLHL